MVGVHNTFGRNVSHLRVEIDIIKIFFLALYNFLKVTQVKLLES